jgi:hypothetical protein
MNIPRFFIAAGFVRWWVRLYTLGLPSEDRHARREEIESDIWEQSEFGRIAGNPHKTTTLHICTRFILGIPMDVSWRLSGNGVERNAAMIGAQSARQGGGRALRFAFRSYVGIGTLSAAAVLVLMVGSWTVIRDQALVGDRVDTSAIGLSNLAPNPSVSDAPKIELSSVVPYMAVKARTRQGDTVTRLSDGRVLVVGDFSSLDDWNGAQVYNPNKDVWKSTAYLVDKRRWHSSTLLLDGRVLVTGGRERSGEVLHTVEVFDPIDNSWTSTSVMHYGRAFHGTALLNDGRVLAVGGFDNDLRTLASAEIYDPDTQTWTLIDDMSESRFFLSASVLHDGRVLVIGGSNNSTGPAATHKTAEIYDPVSDNWSQAGQLAANRTGHSSTVLKDGRVLVVGGGGLDSNLSLAEIYDPTINTWSPAGITTLARAGHSAALMSDGRVIVAGGWSDDGSANHVAEIYDPRVGTWFAMAVTP